MRAQLGTAGESLAIECAVPWVGELITEGAGAELCSLGAADASLQVSVEAGRHRFDTRGWPLLTRGAWSRDGEVVIENVVTSGFDLHVRCSRERAEFTYRWRPPRRERAAALGLRSRFHLLARAALMQYPVLWWSGTRGRAPLHASACTVGASTPLLTAPSGVGRSTLLLEELSAGERATGDNLAVGDGTLVWGLAEPLRVEGAGGRRMPHGRREAPMPGRVDSLAPDSLIVLERGTSENASLAPRDSLSAARSLVTSTYMAGELRRYWALAATLSAGTGLGPAHPPIADIAASYAARLRCFSLTFAKSRGTRLAELLPTIQEIGACA
jgi:hypothetical protein